MQPKTARRFIALILSFACALARMEARAQFSAPYDPDFSPKEHAREKVISSVAPAEAPGVVIVMPAGVGPFLLIDRPDPNHILEETQVPASTAPVEFEAFEEALRGPEFSTAAWAAARAQEEEKGAAPPALVTPLVSAGPETFGVTYHNAKAAAPEIEMPESGTSLSVTGRKVIGVNYNEQRYTKTQTSTGRPQTTNQFQIQQQTQIRMQGKVGSKITVNVDYDDTQPDHQDISVVYNGDPDEVVQNVSFGDIDLSLPSTEFVSYNKQLFGIRADVKYKGVSASVIGSRTKGTTKLKQFFGNTQYVKTDIQDTAFIQHQYYDLTFGNPSRLPLKPGSEQVFIDNQNLASANINTVNLTVNDLAVQTSSFTGLFQQMFSGQDYTVDYARGILTFRTPLQGQALVAVDAIDASGNHLAVETSTASTAACANNSFASPPCFNALRLIKTPSDLPISTTTEVGYLDQLKTWYSIGQNQIVPDNGKGNFIWKVLDPTTRNDVGSTLTPPEVYPQTITVNFADGLFNLQQPFGVISSTTGALIPDPQIYATTPISKRIIHVEYYYRFKTFFLEPNLVSLSEVVLLDKVKLTRNVDYFIDYNAGFITFFNPDRIQPTSEIDISYELKPFAGISSQSLLGSRLAYTFNDHFQVGTTWLYQTGAKSPTAPDITDLSQTLLVGDANAQLTDIPLAGNYLKMTSLTGEFAQSRQEMNINGNALVDNMEGINQESDAPTFAPSWEIAANPQVPGVSSGLPTYPGDLTWTTEVDPVLSINPHAQANASNTQNVLDVNYNFAHSNEQSIVFPFSTSGLDFSQRTILQVVVLGDASGNDIDFHLGTVNEDADSSGGMTLHCANGATIFNAPKTEDLACTGILQPSEDVGWTYAPPIWAPASIKYGANNGILDSEALDGNEAKMNPGNFTGGDFGFVPDPNNANNMFLFDATDNSSHTVVDFGPSQSWQTLEIPLNISSATASLWTAIRQIRVTVHHHGGGATAGTLKFAKIAVLGTTWQNGVATDPSVNAAPIANESLLITPVNNVNNPNYVPIFSAGGDAQNVFNELYGSVSNVQQQSNTTNISEQALQLRYSNMTTIGSAASVVTTKRTFSTAIDISQHKNFNFLINANSGGAQDQNDTFFLRVGNDTNFWEVDVPLNRAGWQEVSIVQHINAFQQADGWRSISKGPPGTVITSSGTPSLQQVAEIVAGVRHSSSAMTTDSGIVWLDEIFVDGALSRTGQAHDVAANFAIPGWATFGVKDRYVDRNFQTPTSVVSNQDNRLDSAFLNFTRVSFFPMAFNVQKQVTNTPNTAQTGSLSNTVNLLQEGKVTNWTGSGSGNLTYGSLPSLNLTYNRNYTDYDLLTRTDDKQSYGGTLNYTNPIQWRVLPKTISANYTYGTAATTFRSPQALALAGDYNTKDISQSYGGQLSFAPWTGSYLNPTYSLATVKERRADFTSGSEVDSAYNVSLTQNAGFTSAWQVTSWLVPQVSYQASDIENNILNVSTYVVNGSTYIFQAGQVKTVNRTAAGNANIPLSMNQIFPSSRLFHSLNIVNGYQLNDGDTWNGIESGLNTTADLWVRTPLRPKSPGAQLQNQTLRDTYNSTQRWVPLEMYDMPVSLSALKTLSLTNNVVYSIQRTDVTGTQTRTITTTVPDAVISMSKLETLLHAKRWLNGGQLNVRYQMNDTLTVGQTDNTSRTLAVELRGLLWRRFDTLMSFNDNPANNRNLLVNANTQSTLHQDATLQTTFDIRRFRFTPKVFYTLDTTTLGTGVKTQEDTTITPSLLMRVDTALPEGLKLPFTNHVLLFTNRVIWTTTLSYAYKSSPVAAANNTRLLSLTTSSDYELTKNMRLTLNGGVSENWSPFVSQDNYYSLQLGMNFTFQF